MDYREYIVKTIGYIEENLCENLDLSGIARTAGYSAYHFARLFKKETKLTPGDYIRKRRLTEIIKRMNESNRPASEIAFEYGFNSKENFVRAFKSEHAILPTEYRAAKNSLKLYEALRLGPDITGLKLEPDILTLEPFALAVYPSDEDYIPNFWNKYNGKGLSKVLSGGLVCEDYGVNTWNDDKKRLDYYTGIREEKAFGDVSGAVKLFIPGGPYAVFATPPTTHYHFVNTIHQTWDYIFCAWFPQSAYRVDGGAPYQFESYTEESRTYSEKIYIPVQIKEKVRKIYQP